MPARRQPPALSITTPQDEDAAFASAGAQFGVQSGNDVVMMPIGTGSLSSATAGGTASGVFIPALAPSQQGSPTLTASSPPHPVPLLPSLNQTDGSPASGSLSNRGVGLGSPANSNILSHASTPQHIKNANMSAFQAFAVSSGGDVGSSPSGSFGNSPGRSARSAATFHEPPPPMPREHGASALHHHHSHHHGSGHRSSSVRPSRNENSPPAAATHHSNSNSPKRKQQHQQQQRRRVSVVSSSDTGGDEAKNNKENSNSINAHLSPGERRDAQYIETQTSSTGSLLRNWFLFLLLLWILSFVGAGAILLVSFTVTPRAAVAASCLDNFTCNDLPTSTDYADSSSLDGLFVPTEVIDTFPSWSWGQCLALIASGKESSTGDVVPVVNTTLSTAWFQVDSIQATVTRPSVSSRRYTLVANSTNNDPPRLGNAPENQTPISFGPRSVVMRDAISPSVVSKITIECTVRFASSSMLSSIIAEAQLPDSTRRKTRLAAADSNSNNNNNNNEIDDIFSNPQRSSCVHVAENFDSSPGTESCDPPGSRYVWIAILIMLILSLLCLLAAAVLACAQQEESERLFHCANAIVEEMTLCATIMNVNWGTYRYDSKDIDLSALEIATTLVQSKQGRVLLARKVRAKKNLENLLSFVPRAVRNPAMRELQERDLTVQNTQAFHSSSEGEGESDNDDPILLTLIPPQGTSPGSTADFRGMAGWNPSMPTRERPLSKVPSYRSDGSGGAGGGQASTAVSGFFTRDQIAAAMATSSSLPAAMSGTGSGPGSVSTTPQREQQASSSQQQQQLLSPNTLLAVSTVTTNRDPSSLQQQQHQSPTHLSASNPGFASSSASLLAAPDGGVSSRRHSTSTHSSGIIDARRASSVMDRRAASRLRRSATPFMGPSDAISNAATAHSSNSAQSGSLGYGGNNAASNNADFTQVRLAPGSVMRRRRASAIFCKLHFEPNIPTLELPKVSELLDQFVYDVSTTAKMYSGVVVEFGFGTALIQWNGFTPYGLHETQSCLCALALAGHFNGYEENMRYYTDVGRQADFGICINTGIMTVGLCGTVGNLNMFCLGDPVTHMRTGVELGRIIGCRVMALHETVKATNARIVSVPVDVCSFDNGLTKTVVHEVRCDGFSADMQMNSSVTGSLTSFTASRGPSQEEQQARPHYMKGFMYLSQSRYDEAQESFQNAQDINGEDQQISRLLMLCYSMAQHCHAVAETARRDSSGEFAATGDEQAAVPRIEYVRLAPAWIFPEADAETMDLIDEAERRRYEEQFKDHNNNNFARSNDEHGLINAGGFGESLSDTTTLQDASGKISINVTDAGVPFIGSPSSSTGHHQHQMPPNATPYQGGEHGTPMIQLLMPDDGTDSDDGGEQQQQQHNYSRTTTHSNVFPGSSQTTHVPTQATSYSNSMLVHNRQGSGSHQQQQSQQQRGRPQQQQQRPIEYSSDPEAIEEQHHHDAVILVDSPTPHQSTTQYNELFASASQMFNSAVQPGGGGGGGSSGNNTMTARDSKESTVNSVPIITSPTSQTNARQNSGLFGGSIMSNESRTLPPTPEGTRGSYNIQLPDAIMLLQHQTLPSPSAAGAAESTSTRRGSGIASNNSNSNNLNNANTSSTSNSNNGNNGNSNNTGKRTSSPTALSLLATMQLSACECNIGKFRDRENRMWTCGNVIDDRGSFGFTVHTGVSVTDGSLAELSVFHLPAELLQTLSPEKLDELVTEVRVANSIRHPCIQTLHSTALAEGHLVLIKEPCGGGTLAELVCKFGALGVTALRRFAQDIAKGLACFHSQRNTGHGAIDTKNILLSTDGFCKIVLTGTAAFRTGTRADEFCAPELVESDGASMPGDVWGFGIVLCYMFSGESPYATTLQAMEDGVFNSSTTDANSSPSLRSLIGSRVASPVNPVKADTLAAMGNASLSNINFGAGGETDEMLRGLIDQCLQPNPARRVTVPQILSHPFFLI